MPCEHPSILGPALGNLWDPTEELWVPKEQHQHQQSGHFVNTCKASVTPRNTEGSFCIGLRSFWQMAWKPVKLGYCSLWDPTWANWLVKKRDTEILHNLPDTLKGQEKIVYTHLSDYILHFCDFSQLCCMNKHKKVFLLQV